MFTLAIWWLGILVESVVLLRGIRNRNIAKYPFFYVYIASVCASDLLLYFIYTFDRASYQNWTRGTEVLNLVLGCGIVLEIFRHVLAPYPGAERSARIVGLIVLALIFCFAAIYPSLSTEPSHVQVTKVEIERDFLTAQAILLFVLLGVISYYGITIGKTLRGVIAGYGLWLGRA